MVFKIGTILIAVLVSTTAFVITVAIGIHSLCLGNLYAGNIYKDKMDNYCCTDMRNDSNFYNHNLRITKIMIKVQTMIRTKILITMIMIRTIKITITITDYY